MTRSTPSPGALLDLGVIGSSAKENEQRLPLHPEHLPHLDEDLRQRITLEHGYGRAVRGRRRRPGAVRGRLRHAGRDPGRLGRGRAAEAAARGRRRAVRRPGALGLAALRAGRGADPARHRPEADADRLRGDEPLDPGRPPRAARVPQEQRAGRLLLGDPRPAAGRADRRLRTPAERGGDRLRRDRAGCRHGAERARRPRGRRAHQPGRGGGRGPPSTRCGSASSTTSRTASTSAT